MAAAAGRRSNEPTPRPWRLTSTKVRCSRCSASRPDDGASSPGRPHETGRANAPAFEADSRPSHELHFTITLNCEPHMPSTRDSQIQQLLGALRQVLADTAQPELVLGTILEQAV